MDPISIRQKIRDVYGDAVTRGETCCGPDHGGEGTIRTSFGCGDPLSMLELQAGDTVLDIGSGPGADALAAARRVGPTGRVIGVDMTEAMLAKARENARAAGMENVEFRAGDAERLPVEDGSIDRVISNCVVNLVPDKKAVFAEIFRVLRPGGSLSITDLVGENLPDEILSDQDKYCECIGGAPDETAYLDAIRQAGFGDVTVADRFPWEVPELEGTAGHVWSIKVTARRPASVYTGMLEPAHQGDLPSILALLARCGLPADGVPDHLGRFVVARESGRLVGCTGVEVHGKACVLRSLAVEPSSRGRGIAHLLIDRSLDLAREAGCTDAYLLTFSAAALAAKKGFKRITREDVPASVLASREFQLDGCSTAIVMHMTFAA